MTGQNFFLQLPMEVKLPRFWCPHTFKKSKVIIQTPNPMHVYLQVSPTEFGEAYTQEGGMDYQQIKQITRLAVYWVSCAVCKLDRSKIVMYTYKPWALHLKNSSRIYEWPRGLDLKPHSQVTQFYTTCSLYTVILMSAQSYQFYQVCT